MSVYTGRTPKEEYKQLLEMLDNVFFLEDKEEPPRTFLTLLPKLYKEEYDPCHNNLCVMEDGIIKAAVGLYPMMATAAGQQLKIGGIGNVAVARDARRAGHMITAMNLCLEQMQADGTDFSLLGGQRQRYGFFGYEPAGFAYQIGLDEGNISRQYGDKYTSPFTVQAILPSDTEVLNAIFKHFAEAPFCVSHAPALYYDVLCSWNAKPFAVFKDGVLCGHFSVDRDGKGLHELYPFDPADTMDLAIAAMRTIGSSGVDFRVAPYALPIAEICAAKMGGMRIEHVEMINIFCYENFIRGFLGVKAAYETLCDGELTLLIHGYKADEQLHVAVQNNTVTVEPTQLPPDLELGHHEAIRMLASLYSLDRYKLSANVRSWFPLPFYFVGHDGV